MASRLELQDELEDLLGSESVYFEPPESLRMKYPCIRYVFRGVQQFRADNKNYATHRSYTVTHIYRDPDGTLVDAFLSRFQMIDHDRHYTADGLVHDVYTIFY